MPKTSPLKVPETATIKEEQKQGYDQVKYSWQRGEYKYQSRWHTRTPNAPKNQGNTWVVERRIPGIGNGPNARPSRVEILVGRTASGNNKWVDKKLWDAAIYARKNGTCTKQQKEIAYHIWDGYFEDIFGKPQTTDEGWSGFTRDYNEFINAFEDDCIECAVDPEEYLRDLILYQGCSFSYNETTDVLNCLIELMTKSKELHQCVLVKVN